MDERIAEIAQRVINWFKKGRNSPYECRLSPTNNCNLACLPCVSRGRPAHNPKNELSTNEYLRLIEEALEIGVRRFDVCGGGEPFMRKDILLLLEKIKEGAIGSISTSGVLITKKIAKKIVEIGWDEIRFSINGPNEKIDGLLRGKGAFKLSIRAIKYLNYFKKQMKREKPEIILMPVITSLNYNKIIEFIKLAKKLEIRSIALQPFLPEIVDGFEKISKGYQLKLSKKLSLNEKQSKEFEKLLKEGEKLARKYSITTNFSFLKEEHVELKTSEILVKQIKKKKNKIAKVLCYMPWWDLDIATDGQAGICARMEKRISIRGKSLEEVWNWKEFNSLRKKLAKGKVLPICKSCCAFTTWDNQKIRDTIEELLK